jgi:hypothetical protein
MIVDSIEIQAFAVSGSGSVCLHEAYNGIEPGKQFVATRWVFLVCAVFYFAGAQTGQAIHQLPELRPIVRANSSSLAPKVGTLAVKLVSDYANIFPFNPGPPSVHKSEKISLSICFRGFRRMSPVLALSTLGQKVSGGRASNAATDASADKANNNRDYVWHFIAGTAGGVIGGIFGVLAYLAVTDRSLKDQRFPPSPKRDRKHPLPSPG